ncbi:tetratricopeptide repeat protein [Rhodonellum sp.]|uniref:tetratricopeptide repeat protein n=1 Tax=Rhodonellum sp. TaxID=2231180 RepID=UPI002727C01F|nr:tetratricopeptide repeat protein [Rhodonellum sp.]MDO9551577.1 tetratricopeptide repeat protein [Rhodonellum sp.]
MSILNLLVFFYLYFMKIITLLAVVLFPYCVHAQHPHADGQMRDAIKISEKGNPKQAEWIFSKIISDHPFFAEPYFQRAGVREKMGDLEGALTDYNILLELSPTHTEGIFSRGIVRYEMKHYELSKEDFLKVLALPQGETNSVLYRKSPYKSGIDRITTLQNGQQDYIYQHLGLICMELEDYNEALHYLEKAIALRPDDPDHYLHRGKIFQSSGQVENAEKDYIKALSLNPYHPMVHQYMGILANASGDKLKADRYYSQAIAEAPDVPYPYKQRGYQRLIAGQIEGALEDFHKVLELKRDDVETLLYRGFAFEKKGELGAAQKDFEQVLVLEPSRSQAWIGLGDVQVKSGKLPEAVKSYTLAIIYQPENPQAHYQRGIAHHKLKDVDQACIDFQQAAQWGLEPALKALEKACQ